MNFLLIIFLFYYVHSQLSFLTSLLEENLPIAYPDITSHTAIVIPFTGKFLLVNSFILFSLFASILVLIFLLWFIFLRK